MFIDLKTTSKKRYVYKPTHSSLLERDITTHEVIGFLVNLEIQQWNTKTSTARLIR